MVMAVALALSPGPRSVISSAAVPLHWGYAKRRGGHGGEGFEGKKVAPPKGGPARRPIARTPWQSCLGGPFAVVPIPECNNCRGSCRQVSGIAVANAHTHQHTGARTHTESHSV